MDKIDDMMLFIQEVHERCIVGFDIDPERTDPRPLKRIISLFRGTVDDPRMNGKITYHLHDILAMMFIGKLGQCDSFVEIADFWEDNIRLYNKLFCYERIPSHDTMGRIMSLIDPKQFQQVLFGSLALIEKNIRKAFGVKSGGKKVVPVDGKVLRGTGMKGGTDEKTRDLQTMNVVSASSYTVLFSDEIEEKTNEIGSARQMLSMLDLSDTIVTADAMNAQKDTVRVVTERGGDYVIGLKGNHGILHDFAKAHFDPRCRASIISRHPERYLAGKVECAHNNIEKREYFMHLLTAKQKKEFMEWAKLKGILCCRKTISDKVSGKESVEMRYYISSITDVEQAAIASRRHWAVEVGHWYLDTVMLEDDMQVRSRTAAHNMSILNKTCIAMYRYYRLVTGDEISIKRIRKKFGRDITPPMKLILATLDQKTLLDVLVITGKEKQTEES